MANQTSVDTQTVLDDLVRQFSDPMSFLRELIQNSIDAGSGEVDVRLEYEEGATKDEGVLIAHVDDFGEGMSREIIESKLTRLFSSGKDEDYTKIGRFGIGFVSVFAIEPQVVCVDTGRAGEYWRVLFHEDRTYDLISMDMPTEGTQIRIIKSMSRQAFERFEQRTKEVILFWCRYVQVPIYLNGEALNETFDIKSGCKATFEEEGTRIVAGFVDDFRGDYGYYNRGLTLKEGSQSPWPHIAIKIDSRYLEHTLTRDQVLEDKNYHKAQQLMTKLVERTLPALLIDRLEAAAKTYLVDSAAYDEAARFSILFCQHIDSQTWFEQRALFPTLYDESPLTLTQIKRLHGRGVLYWASGRDHLTNAMMDDVTVIQCAPGGAILKLLNALLGIAIEKLSDAYILPAASILGPGKGERALTHSVKRLVRALGAAVLWVGFADFGSASKLEGALVWLTPDRQRPMPWQAIRVTNKAAFVACDHLVLNGRHADIINLTKVATKEPEWAAYTLLKMVLLQGNLTTHDDTALMTMAIDLRTQRLR